MFRHLWLPIHYSKRVDTLAPSQHIARPIHVEMTRVVICCWVDAYCILWALINWWHNMYWFLSGVITSLAIHVHWLPDVLTIFAGGMNPTFFCPGCGTLLGLCILAGILTLSRLAYQRNTRDIFTYVLSNLLCRLWHEVDVCLYSVPSRSLLMR